MRQKQNENIGLKCLDKRQKNQTRSWTNNWRKHYVDHVSTKCNLLGEKNKINQN